MKGLVAAAILALVAPVIAAQEVAPPHYRDPNWGRPARIVPPEFPPGALAEARTGSVDVTGWVDGLGRLHDAQVTPVDGDAAAIFVAPVKEVLPHWLFHPVTGNDCMHSKRTVTNRVTFEVQDGKPKISVLMLTKPERAKSTMTSTRKVAPAYPGSMLRRNREAIVYARIEVDAEGRATHVATQAFATDGSEDSSPFEREVQAALRKWRWTEAEPGDPSIRKGCFDIYFRIRD